MVLLIIVALGPGKWIHPARRSDGRITLFFCSVIGVVEVKGATNATRSSDATPTLADEWAIRQHLLQKSNHPVGAAVVKRPSRHLLLSEPGSVTARESDSASYGL
jgi:hypothetical protein